MDLGQGNDYNKFMSKAQDKEVVKQINDVVLPKEANDALIKQQYNPEKVPLIEAEVIKTQPAHIKTDKIQSKKHHNHQSTSKTKIKITQSESKKGEADGRLTEKFQIDLGNIKLKLKEKDPKGRRLSGQGKQLKNPQTYSEKQEKKMAKEGYQTERKEEERIQEIMNHIKPYIEQIQRITKRKKRIIKGEQEMPIRNEQPRNEVKDSNEKQQGQCIEKKRQVGKQNDKEAKKGETIKQDEKQENLIKTKQVKVVKQVPSEHKHAQTVTILPQNYAPLIALPLSFPTFSHSLVIPNLHEYCLPLQNKQNFLSQSLPSRLKPLFSQRPSLDSNIISFSSLQTFQFPNLPLIPIPSSPMKSPQPIHPQHPVQLSSNVFNISIGQILHPNFTAQARMLLSEISKLKGKIGSLEKRRVTKRVVSPKNRCRSIDRVETIERAYNLSYTFTKLPQTSEGSAIIHFPSTHQNPSTPVGVNRSRKSFRLKSHKKTVQSLSKEIQTELFTIPKPYPRRLNFQSNFRQQTDLYFSWYKPTFPNPQWSQQQLLLSARRLFKMLGVDIDSSDQPPLLINKYKNCLSFVLDTKRTIVWYFSGRFYYGGCSLDGGKEGWGFDYCPERYVYSGDFCSNRRNGNGVMKHLGPDQGIIYEGEWRDNQKHGIGRQIQPNGEEYIGEWVHGEKKGRGWLKTEHSSIFQVKIEEEVNAVDFEKGYQNNRRTLWNKEKYKKAVGNSTPLQKSGDGQFLNNINY